MSQIQIIEEKSYPPVGAIPPPGFLISEPAIRSAPTERGSCFSTNSPTAASGIASGALALLHDFNSEKVVGISLDVPVKIELAAQCFDNDAWWGLPTALRAAIWLSIPGSGPEGIEPLAAMEESARIGDKQGVALARAMFAMMAENVGDEDAKCRALAGITPDGMSNGDYALLNAYARQMMTHQADLAWTRKLGYRAPFQNISCPQETPDVSMSESDLDDILGDIDLDDTVPAQATEPATTTEPSLP